MHIYLDRAVINKKAIQGVKRLAGTVELGEGDRSNPPANAIRPVGKLDTLDWAN